MEPITSGMSVVCNLAAASLGSVGTTSASQSYFLSRVFVSDAANAMSILGFFMTIFVMWRVQSLHSRFLFTARAPELVKNLEVELKNLKSASGDSNQKLVNEAIDRVVAVLGNLAGKVPRKTVTDIKSILDDANSVKSNTSRTKEAEHRLISSLGGFILTVKLLVKDNEWSKGNG